MTDHPPRILTVCLGNICRSPTAEAAVREAAAAAGLAVEVSSAGTGDWHVGSPPDARQQAAATTAGLPLTGTAAQLTVDDLTAADLVLVMDRANLVAVADLADAAGVAVRVRLLRSYDPASVSADDLEVPDPYAGGPAGFRGVVELCRAAAVEVVAALDGRRAHPDRA